MKRAYGLVALALFCLGVLPAQSAAPGLINYQGVLYDNAGIEASNDYYGIEFRIWDAPTGGTLVWGEINSAYVASGGVFNVLLGNGTVIATGIVTDLSQAFTGSGRYLGLTVTSKGGGPLSPAVEIAPRQQLASAPFAIHASDGAPVGSIMPFAGSSAPAGWLLCDGAVLNTSTYANLFGVIQYKYGGSGANFNLPNLKGRVPVGLNSSETEFDLLGEAGGAKTHTLTDAEMPAHAHDVNPEEFTVGGGAHTHGIKIRGGWQADGWNIVKGDNNNNNDWNSTPTTIIQSSEHSHTFNLPAKTSTSTGSGQAHNNLPPYLVLNYIIKY